MNKMIPFKQHALEVIPSIQTEMPRNRFTKEEKVVSIENYNALLKQIKEDLTK